MFRRVDLQGRVLQGETEFEKDERTLGEALDNISKVILDVEPTARYIVNAEGGIFGLVPSNEAAARAINAKQKELQKLYHAAREIVQKYNFKLMYETGGPIKQESTGS